MTNKHEMLNLNIIFNPKNINITFNNLLAQIVLNFLTCIEKTLHFGVDFLINDIFSINYQSIKGKIFKRLKVLLV